MDKVDQQQAVIESQLKAIQVQEQEYASQQSLVRLLTLFLVIILSLAVYSIYSTVSLSNKKRQLEQINQTVITQKDEIEAMAEVARQHNEVKLGFFTGLSHEFKTPITLIMSYVESMIENDRIKSTRLIDEMKLIYANSHRLLRLINQLLDFRKLEERKFTLRASATSLYSFTTGVMANFKGEAARRNIDFELVCDNKELELFIDQSLMDKVYFNLLSNAFKFTPDNGKITITLKEAGNIVQIQFKDSGIGIPAPELPQVFNPFFRASNNNRNSSGIGLNLSREFVLLHGGTITVSSHHGAVFTIELQKGSAHLQPSEITQSGTTAPAALFTDMLTAEPETLPEITTSEKHTLLIWKTTPTWLLF